MTEYMESKMWQEGDRERRMGERMTERYSKKERINRGKEK